MTHTEHPENKSPMAPPTASAPTEGRADKRSAAEDPSETMAPGHARPNAARVAPAVARQIDENLKRLYRDRIDEELPPQLQALVERLRSGGETQ